MWFTDFSVVSVPNFFLFHCSVLVLYVMLAGLVLAWDHSGHCGMDLFGDIGLSQKFCVVQSVSWIDYSFAA